MKYQFIKLINTRNRSLYFQYLLVRLRQQPLYSTICISYQDTSCIQSQNQDRFLRRENSRQIYKHFFNTIPMFFSSVYTTFSPRICICSLGFPERFGQDRKKEHISKSPTPHATCSQKQDISPSTFFFILKSILFGFYFARQEFFFL